MNGPEHYRRAEELLKSCQMTGANERAADGTEIEIYSAVLEDAGDLADTCRNALMAAQVHATLALVAVQGGAA